MEKELNDKLNKVITEHGVRIDAFVPLLDKIDTTNKLLEKLQKLLYFMESRQKRAEEVTDKRIIDLLEKLLSK